MENISHVVKKQREFFRTGKTRDVDFRLQNLKKFKKALWQFEERIYDAFWKDLRKSKYEVFGTEIGMISLELKHHIRKIRRWSRPTRVRADMLNIPSSSRIIHEPYGNVLIISPWNYPLQLALLPLVGAISAGNCVLVKPAHYSENVSRVISELIGSTFPSEYIHVVTGDRTVNQAVLEERYDLIFFTGSPHLGRIVMGKAARHLTPVVLELGGKSPCIVENDAKLDVAVQRICFGKFINSGQTCIAPDHLFVHREVKDRVLQKLAGCIRGFYGDDPEKSPDFGRIINQKQFDRLIELRDSAGKIIHGGRSNREDRYIEPTIIDGITYDDPIMQEETFGPLLPVLTYDRLEEVIPQIVEHEKPLAMYFFSSSKRKRDLLLSSTSSGGGCVNDTIMHITNPKMPFGGVGNSGMGSYHGKFSFDTFSHHRSILRKTTLFNPTVPYPPYGNKLKYTKWLFS